MAGENERGKERGVFTILNQNVVKTRFVHPSGNSLSPVDVEVEYIFSSASTFSTPHHHFLRFCRYS
jgi:hypothetical protein